MPVSLEAGRRTATSFSVWVMFYFVGLMCSSIAWSLPDSRIVAVDLRVLLAESGPEEKRVCWSIIGEIPEAERAQAQPYLVTLNPMFEPAPDVSLTGSAEGDIIGKGLSQVVYRNRHSGYSAFRLRLNEREEKLIASAMFVARHAFDDAVVVTGSELRTLRWSLPMQRSLRESARQAIHSFIEGDPGHKAFLSSVLEGSPVAIVDLQSDEPHLVKLIPNLKRGPQRLDSHLIKKDKHAYGLGEISAHFRDGAIVELEADIVFNILNRKSAVDYLKMINSALDVSFVDRLGNNYCMMANRAVVERMGVSVMGRCTRDDFVKEMPILRVMATDSEFANFRYVLLERNEYGGFSADKQEVFLDVPELGVGSADSPHEASEFARQRSGQSANEFGGPVLGPVHLVVLDIHRHLDSGNMHQMRLDLSGYSLPESVGTLVGIMKLVAKDKRDGAYPVTATTRENIAIFLREQVAVDNLLWLGGRPPFSLTEEELKDLVYQIEPVNNLLAALWEHIKLAGLMSNGAVVTIERRIPESSLSTNPPFGQRPRSIKKRDLFRGRESERMTRLLSYVLAYLRYRNAVELPITTGHGDYKFHLPQIVLREGERKVNESVGQRRDFNILDIHIDPLSQVYH